MGLFTRIVLTLVVEPWISTKLETTINEKSPNLKIQISKVHITLFFSGIELKEIIIDSNIKDSNYLYVKGTIASIKLKGTRIIKALLSKDIFIRNVTITDSELHITTPEKVKTKSSLIIPSNIKIDRLLIDKTHLFVGNNSNSLTYSLFDGMITANSINFNKLDSLSIEKFQDLEFFANEITSVSADSLHSFNIKDLSYSSLSNILSADTISILPNFSDYAFTSRYEFQKDRIESIFSNIKVKDFSAAEYMSSGILSSSSIEIGNMEMKVFRDRRKEFRHVIKPEFQDMISRYPGYIRLDTISILNGNITYRERAEESNEAGYITFSKVNASIYNINNDSIFMSKKAYFELRFNSFLMGKSKMSILLKSRIYDSRNSFSVNGTLSAMDISVMNPYLENNAFIYVTSGKLDGMDFSFTANSTEANGTMTMLYTGLDLTIKNKKTDDTTAFKERLKSLIVNIKVIDSNPLQGKEAREGIIKYERDPEKFLFNYIVKSTFSGIKSTMLKNKKDK